MPLNKYSKKSYSTTQHTLVKLALAILTLTADMNTANANNYWRCGGDEDGCVDNACLCMPKMLSNTSCCLDFDNDQYPCAKQPEKGCTVKQIKTTSQHDCLSIFFDNNCTNKKTPEYNCSMICNTGGGECREAKI